MATTMMPAMPSTVGTAVTTAAMPAQHTFQKAHASDSSFGFHAVKTLKQL